MILVIVVVERNIKSVVLTNEQIKNTKHLFFIDSYLPWGTPTDLKTFIYWQKYFDLWNNHPYRKKIRVL